MKSILDGNYKCYYKHPTSNKLPSAKRAQIIAMLREGPSVGSISRVVDVSINAVTKLLANAGEACAAFHDDTVRKVRSERVQCDEIWSFCYAKQRNVDTAKAAPDGAGNIWTWTALDADTKLILWYLVDGRDASYAQVFMEDVADRLATRVQLTTDGLEAYLDAVEGAFGADIDYAQLVKMYGDAPSPPGRYSPGECTATKKIPVKGRPDPKHVSTSHVERQNLTMQMRRCTRLTNAFSKKGLPHDHMVALYTAWRNFVRINKTLRISPAMAAAISPTLWTMEDVVALIGARAEAPKPRGPYKSSRRHYRSRKIQIETLPPMTSTRLNHGVAVE